MLRALPSSSRSKPINLKVEDDKRPKSVFIREIQSDPISRQLIHVDFYQVKKGEKVKIEVPIVLVGEAPAMKNKGRMISHGVTSLSIESLPENLPSQIEVDVSSLEEIGQSIHVRDIVFGPDVTVHADPDQLLVKISEVMVEEAQAEAIKKEDFSPKFSFRNMHKDMHLILEFAEKLGLELPAAKRVAEIYDKGIEELGQEDFSATIKIIEKICKK